MEQCGLFREYGVFFMLHFQHIIITILVSQCCWLVCANFFAPAFESISISIDRLLEPTLRGSVLSFLCPWYLTLMP